MKTGKIYIFDPVGKNGWIHPTDDAGNSIAGPHGRITKHLGEEQLSPLKAGILVRYEDKAGPPREQPMGSKARPADPNKPPAAGTPATKPPNRFEATLVTSITLL